MGIVDRSVALFHHDEGILHEGFGYLEKNLQDFFDIQIFSTVYFGSNLEPHRLIFDTGSSWLWVQSSYCDSCTAEDHFMHRHSASFTVDTNFEVFQINYGSGSVLAFQAEDQVCLDKAHSVCSQAATFGNVVMQHGLDGLQASGIFGLSPSPHTNA